MKHVIVVLLVVLVSGVAFAEKLPDVMNAVPQDGSRIVLTGSLTADSPTYNRIYGGTVSLNCASLVSDSSVDNQYYESFCLNVTDATAIQIWVVDAGTIITDTVMTLYCEPFDPAQPQLNVVLYDDDDGDGLLSAFTAADNLTLTPGNNYYLVLSTFSSGITGDFEIQTSDNVITCSVDDEQVDWGSVKSLYR